MRHFLLAGLLGLTLQLSGAAAVAANAGQGSVLALDRFQLFVDTSGDIAEQNVTPGAYAGTSGTGLLDETYGNVFSAPLGSYGGRAMATPGANHASSWARGGSASGYADGTTWTAGLNAASVWFERFTITGGSGTGTLSLSVLVEGELDVSGPINADGRAGLASVGFNLLTTTSPFTLVTTANGGWPPGGSYHPTSHGLAFACDPLAPAADCDYGTVLSSVGHYEADTFTQASVLERVDATITFTYGMPFYVIGALEASSYAYQLGAEASADFFNTARVTAFVVPGGATVVMDSGAYAAFGLPVPEPSSLLLMLAGTLALDALRRRASPRR